MALERPTTATEHLFATVAQTPAVQSLARRLEEGGALSCAGVNAAAQPFLAVLARHMFPQRSIVVVTDGLKTQESFQQDIGTWLKSEIPSPQPLFYPAWEILPHESKLPHADVISERLETLVALTGHSAMSNRQSAITVTSVAAVLQRTFRPRELQERTRRLGRGDRIDPLDLIEWLHEQGYEPEAQVTQKGEMSSRGGILDVYPLSNPWPVRLEFFGDELESLRHFDPLTQMSRDEIPSVTLPPGGELGIFKQMRNAEYRMPDNDPSRLTPGNQFALGTLLDYLPPETLFVLCEPEGLALRAEEYARQIPTDDPFFISWENILSELGRRGMTRLELSEGDGSVGVQALTCLPDTPKRELQQTDQEIRAPLFDSLDAFRPLAERATEPQIAEAQRSEFFAQLHRWLRQGYAVHVFCNNDGERQRFTEIWEGYGFGKAGQPSRRTAPSGAAGLRRRPSRREERSEANGVGCQQETGSVEREACLILQIGTLTRGFIYNDGKVVVVTDAEVFGRYRVQRSRRLKSPHASAVRSALHIDFTELEEGDYVVHLQHGIGRYLGLKVLPATVWRKDSERPTTEAGQECLVIEFAPNDPTQEPPKLYVPVTEAHLVGKYVGAGKARPPLNTLTGTRWAKAKAHAERAVRDVAGELLAIQAARASQPGHAVAADVPWQHEFEGAFIFEETPDQMRAIQETKRDMEAPKPMDRLICGDVGFGKTEVAIRAAFKAVMDGRQVAALVPTTVLAQQHFNTFRERMAAYPVRIELLSRFRTRREQEGVVKDLAAGAVDIIIGTHRLLQDDIAFKDLGLVIIDEEQRFGVLHKEKFKRLRQLVDVLTLSATPIPRTLYLALTGARDMSTIETPPQDRLPVETIVTQYDERTIRDAIQRELNRGGQVFFLHNRVMTIDTMARKLGALVPQARIVVGHGQMHSDNLEEVMTRFVNGQADVLLSTTIIESGLDIPNANTIIIDRADRFGLSDLYQLRGRVGRYKHQAYAYLLIPRHAGLLADARKRISALKQYSTLGSGFKIAMRDLEIRGAGNLLGAEQSGHITAVGFELYCQLLKQSIAALKGEKVKPRVEVEVRLDFLTSNMERGDLSPLFPSGGLVRQTAPQSVSQSGTAIHDFDGDESPAKSGDKSPHSKIALALLPHSYVPEPQHRIEIYRKLAQSTDKPALESLTRELRDRFGPLPSSAELLLQVAELKIIASENSVSAIEVKKDKLMLTRHGDFITLGGKFPRLTKKDAKARLKEIKKLLLGL